MTADVRTASPRHPLAPFPVTLPQHERSPPTGRLFSSSTDKDNRPKSRPSRHTTPVTADVGTATHALSPFPLTPQGTNAALHLATFFPLPPTRITGPKVAPSAPISSKSCQLVLTTEDNAHCSATPKYPSTKSQTFGSCPYTLKKLYYKIPLYSPKGWHFVEETRGGLI